MFKGNKDPINNSLITVWMKIFYQLNYMFVVNFRYTKYYIIRTNSLDF